MWKSFKVYISNLGYWGLSVIAPIALNIIGIYQLVTGNQFTWVPSWVWFLIAFISLLIIPFLAFHKLRIQSDEFKAQSEEFYFEPTGNSVTLKTGSVLINISFRSKPKVIVDNLHLIVDNVRFTPSEWKPFVVSPQYTDTWTFDLAGKIKLGDTYDGKLIATIDRKEYESREFKVYT